MIRSMHLPRAAELERLRKDGWRTATFKTCSLVIAFRELAGKTWVKAWTRKADKPDWFYTFSEQAKAEAYVQHYAQKVVEREKAQAERNKARKTQRAALKASDHWAVGDVIYNSWGYDQTNIDWYQVVEVLPRSIRIRPIAENCNDHGGPCGGMSAPRRNEFTGAPMLKPLDEYGNISFTHGAGSKWDGRAKSCSSYH